MSTIIKPNSFDCSSPIIFPSGSPRIKLCVSPSRKVSEIKPWQGLTLDSCHSPILICYEDNALKAKETYQLPSTIPPLSITSDILLEEPSFKEDMTKIFREKEL